MFRKIDWYIKHFIAVFGSLFINGIRELGAFTTFAAKFYYWAFMPPFRAELVFEQFYFIGNKSLMIICLAGGFTGMVMAYQVYFGFKMINVDSLVGPVVTIALAKELGPVLTGLIVAGRAGAAMAAQIGTMKVTEQVDALEVMGIDSYQYLAVPRILAATIAVPMLSMIFLVVGNAGSWLVGTKALMIDESLYLSKLSQFVYVEDLLQGFFKSIVFGFTVAAVGTYFGFQVTKGAEGVGKGTNQAVVWGMMLVLVLDYFLTSFLVRIL